MWTMSVFKASIPSQPCTAVSLLHLPSSHLTLFCSPGIGKVHPDGQVLGRFVDGLPAVVLMKSHLILALNFFPPPRVIGIDGGWLVETDGDRLISNAALFLLAQRLLKNGTN